MNFLRAALLTFSLAAAADAADTWPGFRGSGDSATSASQLPVRWSATENIAWKVKLPGYGQSSPVIWKDKIFTTTVAGDEREKGFITAHDLATGKELWRHAFAPTQKAKWSTFISKAAPTPVVDERGVYAFFEGGDVIALDHAGKTLWSRSLVKDYGAFQNNHGLAASPVLTGNAMIVLVDDRGPSYLLALDTATGKNLWKVDRPHKGSWTSPVLSGGQKEIVISSNGGVAGYDPADGKLLWEFEGLTGNTIPSAAVVGERVIVGAGTGKGDVKAAQKSNCCLKPHGKDGKPEVLWNSEKATASMASPLVHRGQVYFVSQAGIVFCLDLESGKERFAERIDGSCWATPVAAGDNVYFFSKNGVTTVLKAGPAFEVVATNSLWDGEGEQPAASKQDAGKQGNDPYAAAGPVLYGVAAVDGAWIVRTGNTLYRIGKR
jgi:outer membrane protein assembly factor BamB